jgi:hypothetical protein
MADFAPTFTPRYLAKYVSVGIEHTVMIRTPRDFTVTAITNTGNARLTALAAALAALLPTDFSWTEAFYIEQDDDVRHATTNIPLDPTGVQDPADYAAMLKVTGTSFSARSAASRTRVTIFGVFWDLSDPAGFASDGIARSGESAAIAAGVSALNGGNVAGNDGGIATFLPWATIKVNDDLLKKVRRGILG